MDKKGNWGGRDKHTQELVTHLDLDIAWVFVHEVVVEL